jgi:hypothetical protein
MAGPCGLFLTTTTTLQKTDSDLQKADITVTPNIPNLTWPEQ